MHENFSDQLINAIEKRNSSIVVGLDPNFAYFPDFINPTKSNITVFDAIFDFNKLIIDAVRNHCVAIKPQLAYYEQYGIEGLRALSHTIEYARKLDLITINDAKRNDIGTTCEAYATAFLGEKGDFVADALTVNPFLGSDGIKPFISRSKLNNKGFFVLVKTSNPSSNELQNLVQRNGKKVYESVAELVHHYSLELMGNHNYSSIGAVVGATFPEEAEKLRSQLPNSFFLVPGVGAQGAKLESLEVLFDKKGYGALIASARGICYSYKENARNWQSINDGQIQEFAKYEVVTLKDNINKLRNRENS